MSTSNKNWIEEIDIRYYDLDLNGKLSFPALSFYIQEAATKHANELKMASFQLTHLNIIWVLYRLQVRMDHYPGFDEKIVIDTWPATIKNPYAYRAFRMFDKEEKEIGGALSTWILIDIDSRRPVRMPDFIYPLHNTERELPITTDFKRMKELETVTAQKEFEVLFTDIDTNKHTNNVSYIKWALETLPFDLRSESSIKEFDIEFRAETFHGDKIISQCENVPSQEGQMFKHQISDAKDKRILALARTLINK
jgi:medium-chain acyl-[acyl-carrier-protein] hydrolase